jgi:glycerophosphoryl diester phosphodiesterase
VGAKPHLGRAWLRDLGRPFILGHRGASALEPENTMAAFEAARRDGADGIELDLQLSACGELVVFHDDDLKRLCGDARLVREVSWEELSELRVEGQAIPRLSEVLEALPDAMINIELKKLPISLARPLVQSTLDAVAAHRSLPRVLLSSFDPRLLGLARLLDPKVPRALLYAGNQGLPLRRGWSSPALALAALHPQETLVTPQYLERAHRRGYLVNTWTVDDPDRLCELAGIGVDAVICNDPGAALQAIGGA